MRQKKEEKGEEHAHVHGHILKHKAHNNGGGARNVKIMGASSAPGESRRHRSFRGFCFSSATVINGKSREVQSKIEAGASALLFFFLLSVEMSASFFTFFLLSLYFVAHAGR